MGDIPCIACLDSDAKGDICRVNIAATHEREDAKNVCRIAMLGVGISNDGIVDGGQGEAVCDGGTHGGLHGGYVACGSRALDVARVDMWTRARRGLAWAARRGRGRTARRDGRQRRGIGRDA